MIREGRSGFARAVAVAAAVLALGTVAMVVDDGPEKSGAACCEGCASKPGASSGIWSGEYRCPEGSGRRPVAFTAFLLQERDGIEAMIREANTFGDDRSPRLHATAEGRYDGATRTLQFVKSYDGTGGVSHDVGYKGTVSSDSAQILEGTWDIAGYQGTYTMKRKAVVE